MPYYLYNFDEELKKAKKLYAFYGKEILRDETCSMLLNEFKTAIDESWKLMKELGVVETCSLCAAEKPGGCCHFGIETWYDNTILLMNMLMDVEIPENRIIENNCLFVGEHGCRLKARYNTCIHHLCPKIKAPLSEYDLFRLRAVTNNEIKAGVKTASAIRDFVRKRS